MEPINIKVLRPFLVAGTRVEADEVVGGVPPVFAVQLAAAKKAERTEDAATVDYAALAAGPAQKEREAKLAEKEAGKQDTPPDPPKDKQAPAKKTGGKANAE